MSDASQGPGWWQASDGKWYPPEAHPSAGVSTAPSGAPPRRQKPFPKGLLIIVIAALLATAVLAVVLASSSKKSKPTVLGTSSANTASSTTTSTQKEQSTTTTTTKPKDLTIESGWSTRVDSIGTRYASAGAAITNPNSEKAAYSVQVVFNLIDEAGTVLDTETARIDYIAPGGRVLAAPLQIGFQAATPPAGVNVSAIGEFKNDAGPKGGDGYAASKGIVLTVVSADIQRDRYGGTIAGQVTNPTGEVVQYPSVTCLFRAADLIVGGTATTITDPVGPGATIAFSAGYGSVPVEADVAECSVTA